MTEQFYTILTSIGKAKIANASAMGTKLNITKLQVGDGGGSYYNPTEEQEQLKNKVWEGNIGSITIDKDNKSWIVIETLLPGDIGGFMIREAGIFDSDGNLIAIGKYPETYKPITSQGSLKDLKIRMILEISNTSTVTLKIDPTVILATQKDIQSLNNKIKNIDSQYEDLTKNVVKSINSKKGDINLSVSDLLKKPKLFYYIDSINGDDNNSGTETTQAFKSFERFRTEYLNIQSNFKSSDGFYAYCVKFLSNYSGLIINNMNIYIDCSGVNISLRHITNSNIILSGLSSDRGTITNFSTSSIYITNSNIRFDELDINLNTSIYAIECSFTKAKFNKCSINNKEKIQCIRSIDCTVLKLSDSQFKNCSEAIVTNGAITIANDIIFTDCTTSHLEYFGGKYFE